MIKIKTITSWRHLTLLCLCRKSSLLLSKSRSKLGCFSIRFEGSSWRILSLRWTMIEHASRQSRSKSSIRSCKVRQPRKIPTTVKLTSNICRESANLNRPYKKAKSRSNWSKANLTTYLATRASGARPRCCLLESASLPVKRGKPKRCEVVVKLRPLNNHSAAFHDFTERLV